MKDNLSIFITIIILVIIIVFLPLYNFFERQDDMSYNLVLSKTTELADDVLNKGYLDQSMYDNYAAAIAATGNNYDIQLEGHKKVITNDPDKAIVDSKDVYAEQYKIDYNADIFSNVTTNGTAIDKSILKDSAYYLNVGDEFYIKIKNKNTTMAGAIFNSIIRTSKKERISVNYGGIVKNNTWAKAENINQYAGSGDISGSHIEGPYMNISGVPLSSVNENSTIYFKARYFNPSLQVSLNNFTGDVSVSSASGYYLITVSRIKSSNDQYKYITVTSGQTTSSPVTSQTFTINDISKIKPVLTANQDVIHGNKIVNVNQTIYFTARIQESWEPVKYFVWEFKDTKGNVYTYNTNAVNNSSSISYAPNSEDTYTFTVYAVDVYDGHTGSAFGFFVSATNNKTGSFRFSRSDAGRDVYLETIKINGAKIIDFTFNVNVSNGHNSGGNDNWTITGCYLDSNNVEHWENIYTENYTWADIGQSLRTSYGQISSTNSVSSGVNASGKIVSSKNYVKLRFYYRVAAGHEGCINDSSILKYNVNYDAINK